MFTVLKGVISAKPGYAGGHTENPSYEDVCTGSTGHAEVVRVQYNDAVIDYSNLLEVFFATHNPTQLNRQGNDIGEQYRSVIFYHNDEQKAVAKLFKKQLEELNLWGQPIVTAIEPLSSYYDAEEYHQNYAAMHPENQYCELVARPNFEKFKLAFGDKLK